MPNRQSRPVQLEGEVKGRGAVADGLLPVPRLEGQFAQKDAATFAGLANQLNTIADRQAVVEGDRAGKIAGQDPNYRPEGSTTLAGMAYEKAATSAYVDKLSVQAREQAWQAFQRNVNDPKGLEADLAKIKAGLDAKDVFPEIRSQFDQDWQRMTMPYRHQAFTDVVGQTRDAAKGAMISRIDSIDREIERLSAAPPSPVVDKRLDELKIERKNTLSRAVEARAINPSDSVKIDIAGEQTAISKRVAGEVLKLPAADRPAALKRIDEERRSGKGPLGQMSDATFNDMKGTVEQESKNEDAQKNRSLAEWSRGASNAQRRLEQNMPIPDMEMAKLRLGKSLLNDPRSDLVMSNIEELAEVQTGFRGKTMPEMQKTLAEMEARAKAVGASDTDARKVKLARKMVGEFATELAKDPVGVAETEGVVKPTPIDFGSGEAFARTLGARLDAAKAVGARYETRWKAFKPEEVTSLKIVLSEGGDRALAVAEALVKAGGPQDARRLLNELSTDVPVLATVGALLATGSPGSREAARDAMRARRMQNEKGYKPPTVNLDAVEQKTLGGALADASTDRFALRDTAKLIYEGRAPVGLDHASGEAEKLLAEAMKDAVGRHKVNGVEYGGVTDYGSKGWYDFRSTPKTVVPPTVRTDRFPDVMKAIDVDMLKETRAGLPVDETGKPYPVETIRKAVPVIGPGGYRLATKFKDGQAVEYLRGNDGRPYVLDFDAVTPALRRKVPGAFLGGAP